MLDTEQKCLLDNGTFRATDLFCEAIFDQILCWSATKAGDLATQSCPLYNSKNNATRYCEPTGKWYVNPDYGTPWTNYSQCWHLYDKETAVIEFDVSLDAGIHDEWLPVMKTISYIGYWISLLALLISIAIFASIRRLQCARNILHVHLFASFILRTVMYLIKEFLFVGGVAMSSDVVMIDGKVQYIKQHYNWMCKAVTSSWHYFILANYTLILMEGIYLHNLIFLKLFSDNNKITMYYCVGWGLPFLFLIPWVILRAEFDDLMCWTTSENKYISMLVQKPLEISVIINFILFISIVKVLFTKLNSISLQQRKTKYRRLIRSTLTLILLFGVPYITFIAVTIFDNETLEIIWIFYDQVFTAFQGFLVSLIYCLLNGDVRIELKRKYSSIQDRRKSVKRSRTISLTQQFTIPLQEEDASYNYLSKSSLYMYITNWYKSEDV